MRLIDVDKLEADIEYWENHDDPKMPDYDTRDIEQVIGFQPIVEAIPIEWIKEWNIEHWEEADDSDDMMVDRMMEDWWQKNVDDQVWEDEWERHLFFERWMKDV